MIFEDILPLAAFVLYTVLFCLVVVLYARMIFKNRKLVRETRNLAVEKYSLLLRLQEMTEEKDSTQVESTEGFLRFISESRDWAFEYIEDVQQALLAYDVALGTDDAKIINDAYKKLISFLPEDEPLS
jgi:hypothetical protein